MAKFVRECIKMLEHHKESIENLISFFKDDSDIISIILGGSVAKGCARADSDIDAIIVVTEAKYTLLEKEHRLSECIYGNCTYENGYFDIKYTTVNILKALVERGSEPARNAFALSICLSGEDTEAAELIEIIPVFQKHEKADKMLSFYSAFNLSYGYFWSISKDNAYFRIKAASDIVLFGLRLILQNNEVLFPGQRGLLAAVGKLENKPDRIIEKAESFLCSLTDKAKEDFVSAVLEFIDYTPPEDFAEVLTRYIDDNELWWYKHRPNISEW